MEVRFLTAGDRAVSVEFGKTICLETNAKYVCWMRFERRSDRRHDRDSSYILCTHHSLPSGSDPVWETGERTGEKTW